MKSLLITALLSCTLSLAQAGSHYIYRPDGQAFYLSGQYLYDSQTGRELGYIQNNYLYDSRTGETIGYLSGNYIYSTNDGKLIGYLSENCQ
jgi:hypothetical protein